MRRLRARLALLLAAAALSASAGSAGAQTAGAPTPGPSPTLVTAPPTSAAPPAGLCTILTVEEVSAALGETVAVVEDTPETCVFAVDGEDASLTGLAVIRERADPEAQEPLTDQVRATFPDATDIEVGGLPGLATADEPLANGWTQAQLVLFPDDDTMLFLAVVVPEGREGAGPLLGLATLAVPRLGQSPTG